MNQREAFAETIVLAITAGMPEESDVDDSLGFPHLQSMLDRIEAEPEKFSEAKLGRWLGWAQAALVASGVGVSLEDVKEINLRHAGGEPTPLDPWPLEYPDGSRARDFEGGVADYLALDGTVHEGGEIGRGLQFKPRLGFEQAATRYYGVGE